MKSRKNNINNISYESSAAAQTNACAILGGRAGEKLYMLCDCSYAKIMELDKKVIPQNKNSDLSGWEDFG